MNQVQIEAIQRSFLAVLPIKQRAAALFYDRLFAIDPELRRLFVHTDMTLQGNKLMAALGSVVGSLQAPDPMLEAVRAMALRHFAYGVRDAHYASVGAALLWTLEAGLGDAWTPDLARSWAEAYRLLSSVMLEATRTASLQVAA